MSATPTAIASAAQDSFFQRLKGLTGTLLFLLFQRFPKLLQLHRNPQAWGLMRVAIAVFGAGLVVLPLSLWGSYIPAIFGLALFLLSILLPPAETESDTDRKARELGALTVVSGGQYQPGNGPSCAVQLFISTAHVWALSKEFEPVVVLPTPGILRLSVEPRGEDWILQIRWEDHIAEFLYGGFFAERFARLAGESIRAAIPAEPELKARAAGAA